jgi:tetratricopeptide (TPR) repeat protein
MQFRYCFRAAALALTSVLAAGCGSVSPAGRRAEAVSTVVASQKPAQMPSSRLIEAHAHYAAGVIHDVREEPEKALEEYYQAAIADPDNEPLILEVSRRFLQNKQPDKALETLLPAAARPNASGAIFARLGFVYAQLGKNDQALAANRVAVKKAPRSLAGYQNLFLNCIQAKQPQEALKVLDEAARQPQPGAEFLIGLGELYANFGLQVPEQRKEANARALTVLNRAEQLIPPASRLRLKLADDYNLVGDSSKASQLYLDLLKQFPDDPMVQDGVRRKLAEIYLRGSDHKKAIEQLTAIIKTDPTSAQACYYLGSIFFDDQKWAEAADYFGKTVLLSPDFEPAYYNLASSQLGLGKSSDAIATLEQARHKFSQGFLLEFLEGMAFSHQKAYAEAIRHYTAAEVVAKATEPDHLNQRFYFELGAACERNGDYDQAEKYFQKSLELSPNFAEALNYLGYMWAEHGVHLDQAREMIEKALKIEPQNAAYLDSLGWVLFKLNQPKEALGYALKAAELSEEPDATVYDHLGDIHHALNQLEEAHKAWQKSLSLEPNDQVKRKLDSESRKE